MTKVALSLALLAVLSVNSAIAADEIKAVPAAAANPDGSVVLEMPDVKTRKRMLFSFGLFGTGFHMGWKKPEIDPVTNEKKGIGSPILNLSVGGKGLGLGVN